MWPTKIAIIASLFDWIELMDWIDAAANDNNNIIEISGSWASVLSKAWGQFWFQWDIFCSLEMQAFNLEQTHQWFLSTCSQTTLKHHPDEKQTRFWHKLHYLLKWKQNGSLFNLLSAPNIERSEMKRWFLWTYHEILIRLLAFAFKRFIVQVI